MLRCPVAIVVVLMVVHAPVQAQTPRLVLAPAPSPVWSYTPLAEDTVHRPGTRDPAVNTAGPSGGRVGLVAGALVGGLVGVAYGRWLCTEHAPAEASCGGPMILIGTGGGLAGALVGYVIGSGFD